MAAAAAAKTRAIPVRAEKVRRLKARRRSWFLLRKAGWIKRSETHQVFFPDIGGSALRLTRPTHEEESTMPQTIANVKVFDREFLGVRARLIELGAALDRIGRASGFAGGDPRGEMIRQAAEILAGNASNKAERIQLLFSLPYEENWQR